MGNLATVGPRQKGALKGSDNQRHGRALDIGGNQPAYRMIRTVLPSPPHGLNAIGAGGNSLTAP